MLTINLSIDQHGSNVHGHQTEIDGDVQGPVFSCQFLGEPSLEEIEDPRAENVRRKLQEWES